MSNSTPDRLTTEDLALIDSVCDRFESEWNSGTVPELDSFAKELKDTVKLEGLVELVVLDNFFRLRKFQNENCETDSDDDRPMRSVYSWSEYANRFPLLNQVKQPREFGYSGKRSTIGKRYAIDRLAGAGGLGRVSVATDRQFDREVAIKEMRTEFVGRPSMRSRFVSEAQITGRLEHPSIVPVYERGQHENGEPYYVMRLVRGQSLLAAIEKRESQTQKQVSLELNNLLQRFVDICLAVEYSHRQGVVHRDIKPENIMLGEFGETLLVDWGLAKSIAAVEDQTNDILNSHSETENTQIGSVIGTPAYMSPEQAAGENNRVSPASDVYCLGATLLHLLTGSISPKKSSDDPGPGLLPRHRMNALLAISRKAMAASPQDRYSSAKDIATDIELALADQPIAVYPDPLMVTMRRWLIRHPAIASTAVAGFLFLLIGLAVYSSLTGMHARELKTKNEQLDQLVESEMALRRKAQKSERRTRDSMAYLVGAMRSPDPNRDGREVKIVDILQQAVDRLNVDFKDDPTMLSQMLLAIAKTYRGLGQLESAKTLSEQAHIINSRELGSDHLATLSSCEILAMILTDLDDRRAVELLDEVVRISSTTLGEEDPNTLDFKRSAAVAELKFGDATKAIQQFASLLRRVESDEQTPTSKLLRLRNDLANAYYYAGQYEDAVAISKKVYEERIAHDGRNALSTITAGSNYAAHLIKTNHRNRAEELLTDLLLTARSALGNEHYQTLRLIGRLGDYYIDENDFAAGMPLLVESYESSFKSYGEKHSRTLVAANSLGTAYLDAADYEKAIDQLQLVYDSWVERHGREYPETLTVANNLAAAYRALGQFDHAISLFEDTVESQEKVLGKDHPNTLRSKLNLAGTLNSANRFSHAIPVAREVYQLASERFSPDHRQAQTAQSLQAMALLELGDYAKARSVLESGLQSRQRTIPGHWLTYNTMSLLGEAIVGEGNYAEAEPILLQAYEQMRKQQAKIPQRARIRLDQARKRIVDLYEAMNKPELAEPFRTNANTNLD